MIKNFTSYKILENNSDSYYTLIEIEEENVVSVHLFKNKEDAEIWIINFVHQLCSAESEIYGDEYACEHLFDVDELIEFYNDRYGTQNGITFHLEKVEPEPKQEIVKYLKPKYKAKKYNL